MTGRPWRAALFLGALAVLSPPRLDVDERVHLGRAGHAVVAITVLKAIAQGR